MQRSENLYQSTMEGKYDLTTLIMSWESLSEEKASGAESAQHL